MKKIIIIMILISSMLVNTAFAGGNRGVFFNPLWVPIAILSTVAATVATIAQPPVIYERRAQYEPRTTVVYEDPRNYRQEQSYERRPVYYNYDRRERAYEAPRYRDNRDYR